MTSSATVAANNNHQRNAEITKENDKWIYRAGWRDWLSWQTGRFILVRSRFRPYGTHLALDTSPISFVEASIRLGLNKALFRGDRIQFIKSSGRLLETKEDAVILGKLIANL